MKKLYNLIDMFYKLALSKVYHVTPFENIEDIMLNGLKPQIGERALKIQESKPSIYFFNTIEDAEQALLGWLGEEFEDIRLCLFEIVLPLDAVVIDGAEYEKVVSSKISPENIKILTTNFGE